MESKDEITVSLADLCLQHRKAGIQKVIDWGKETCPHCIGMTCHYKRVCDTCWQEQWGV